jgi:hypothetical protein
MDGGGLDRDLIEAGLSEAAGGRSGYGESIRGGGAETPLPGWIWVLCVVTATASPPAGSRWQGRGVGLKRPWRPAPGGRAAMGAT